MNKPHHTPRRRGPLTPDEAERVLNEHAARVGSERPMRGTRVRLVAYDLGQADEGAARVQIGTEGTVQFVDDFGTVHVEWDTGVKVGLVRGYDRFEVVGDA